LRGDAAARDTPETPRPVDQDLGHPALSAVDPVDLLKGRMAEALVGGSFKRAQYAGAGGGHETQMPSLIRSGRRDFVPDFVVWRPLDEPSLGPPSYRLLPAEGEYRPTLARAL